MADIYLKRTLKGLAPSNEQAEEAIQKIPVGKVVKAKISQPRNVRHHQKYWAMVGLIHKNQSYFATAEHLHQAIKARCGYSTKYQFKNGDTLTCSDSIAFGKMDQADFEIFYENAVGFVTSEVIPGLTNSDLRRELGEF